MHAGLVMKEAGILLILPLFGHTRPRHSVHKDLIWWEKVLYILVDNKHMHLLFIAIVNLLYYKTLGKLTWEGVFSELIVRSTTYRILADSACHGE